MKSPTLDRRLFSSLQNLPPLERRGERADWVDICKGVSISLVVFWHFLDDRVSINEALIFLRMPLFFFVAGLFARGIFSGTGRLAISNKLINFMWLFCIWSVITLVMTQPPRDMDLVAYLLQRAQDAIEIFVHPPQTLWFIYALFYGFIIVYLTRSLPIILVLGISVVAYMLSVSSGDWRGVDFFERVVRLLPFLLIGIVSFNVYNSDAVYRPYLGPFLLAIVIPASHLVYFSDLASVGAITFLLSLMGISGVVFTARLLSETPVGRLLSVIGAASLFIYVMHRTVQFYLLTGIRIAGVDIYTETVSVILVRSAAALATIAICVWLGGALSRHRRTASLFKVPFAIRP